MNPGKLFLFFILLFCTNKLFAQDTIRTRNDTLVGKVVEIGIDEIKYKAQDNLNGPVVVIDKRDVILIIYENGKRTLFSRDEYEANPEVDIRAKTHCIKFEFFSPLTNDIVFGYETMLRVGFNLEFKLGIIGPGFVREDQLNGSGAFVKVGGKFLISPTYQVNGVAFAHGLKGFYVEPQLIFSDFTSEEYVMQHSHVYPYLPGTPELRKYHTTSGAFNILFGKQHILANLISIDYYLGLGFGFVNTEGPEVEYYYSHILADDNLALSMGLTLGVVF